MRYEDMEITSLKDLITELYGKLNGSNRIWYRGHSKKDWKLLLKLFRDHPDCDNKFEMNLIKKFMPIPIYYLGRPKNKESL
jgi:hypothetical protein